MKTLKNISVPTGNILIVEGEKGKLECLSLGDYGKEKNLKADFLGLSKEINGVPHGELLSLQDKWVITISTQYGCSMECKFCDVPKVGKGINATTNDLVNQVFHGIGLHPEIRHTNRLNVHYARMGEPSFNNNIFSSTIKLKELIKDYWGWGFHPVISTMCPENNKNLESFLKMWMIIKNDVLDGEAGLQISINTTNQIERKKTMPKALPLFEISNLLKDVKIKGRKITLNFALTDAKINEHILYNWFSPDKFLCKITPMHRTDACINNNLLTADGYEQYYPYKDVENRLKSVGFDVIVFIPSKEEDESRITCGNAILADENNC
jgi:23S rRNA (adenine2503-C2)-methyltransferase